ncbi:hypothetical protein OG244_21795 [Streptomyces brevispora]|uniref:hypothetical protein n=1 Tax=Streptomyces brevispora TaxID=887462 RepID=UPI002E306C69|nr:hypothetical protein [Streptomyces brevispora]
MADELRRAPGLPSVPLIVLTALGHDDAQAHLWSPGVPRAINNAKSELHARPASSLPGGKHRIIDDAGHGWLHEERQDAVLKAVGDRFDGTA